MSQREWVVTGIGKRQETSPLLHTASVGTKGVDFNSLPFGLGF